MSTTVRAGVVVLQCDALVIPTADLPPVDPEVSENGWCVGGEFIEPADFGATADDVRRWALRLYALAEYLDAHPPVDEAQVEALASILAQVGDDGTWAIDWPRPAAPIARRLVARGVRVDLP